jgi:hypothetical protein
MYGRSGGYSVACLAEDIEMGRVRELHKGALAAKGAGAFTSPSWVSNLRQRSWRR